MPAEYFTQLFRSEHRLVRDTLLDLVQALQARDQAGIQVLLKKMAAYAGPHFRYEEEALYPALVDIFDEDYIEQLLSDHDRTIDTVRWLAQLASQQSLTDDVVAKAIKLLRALLLYVSRCDGLLIMVEVLPNEKVKLVLDARDHSLRTGLDLLQWASQVRERPAPVISQ